MGKPSPKGKQQGHTEAAHKPKPHTLVWPLSCQCCHSLRTKSGASWSGGAHCNIASASASASPGPSPGPSPFSFFLPFPSSLLHLASSLYLFRLSLPPPGSRRLHLHLPDLHRFISLQRCRRSIVLRRVALPCLALRCLPPPPTTTTSLTAAAHIAIAHQIRRSIRQQQSHHQND